MIKQFFGVPGSGKTTLLSKYGLKELKKIKRGRSKYDYVATINFELEGCAHIKWDDLKKYKMYNVLLLIDEISLDADNRKFKSFDDELRDFFVLHRHFGIDIIATTQDYEAVDKKIRSLTQELWYMSKSVVPFLNCFTYAKRIYRQININEHTSELTIGYRFCNFLESLFVSNFEFVFRPFYYGKFDSFDELTLKDRPVLDFSKHILPKTPRKNFFVLNLLKIKTIFSRCKTSVARSVTKK